MSAADRHTAYPFQLVLASASPRRKEILAAAGIACQVMPSSAEERQGEHETAEEFVCRVAWEKANDIFSRLPPEAPRAVLGADTVVLIDSLVLGKPTSPEDAARMLRILSGREHRVLTGVCLLYSPAGTLAGIKDTALAGTTVKFSTLTEQQIADYIASGEPFDKAGAYAIQGLASKFVERIEGCYFNVMGLPVSLVYQMLQRRAYAILAPEK